ncbi:MAG TPA: PaaI family thioesterase [Candidatus Limnocylindrales bacterium]|nr:PaaI family thioesterase [Candidatus Limnocylindrales bacterium]
MEKAFSDRLKEGLKTPPVAVLIGIRVVSFGGGEAVFEMRADRRHHNPMGTVHGGILCDLADAAMGYAFASTLGSGESFTTLELKINFLRPVFDEKLTARAKVAHRGKTVGMVGCDITNEEGKLVARASSTCSVLRGDAAQGR